MVISSELVSSFLGDLYQAAADSVHWRTFLGRLCQVSNSSKAYFLLVDPEKQCDLSLQTGWDELFAKLYAEQWHKRDIVLDSFCSAQQQTGGDWIGDRESVIDDRVFLRSEVYNDLIRPQGDLHLCAAALGNMPDGLQGGFAMRRGSGMQPYESEVITLLAILAPHMKRAIDMHRRFAMIRAANTVLASSVEAFEIAVVSLDNRGAVIHCSKAASQLLEARDGLTVAAGHLKAALTRENEALQAAVAGAVATGSGSTDGPVSSISRGHAPQSSRQARSTPSFGGALSISRRSSQLPLHVVVTPFRSQTTLVYDRPAALVFLSDPEKQPLPRAQILRALFALTPVECRLVDMLLVGHTLKEAAAKICLTETTARFHLKQIFRKTDVTNQSGLLRLALALPAIR